MTEGLLLGLSLNLGCFTVCAPFILPFVLSENGNSRIHLIKFLAGRLCAYIFFGFTAGLSGLYFNGRINPKVFAIFLLIASLWMILYALGRFKAEIGFCKIVNKNIKGRLYPFFAGFTIGLNICPPFLTALARALQMNSIIKPVIFFISFFIGTSIWIVPLLFVNNINKYGPIRLSGRVIAFCVGAYYIYQSVVILVE